MPDHTGNWFTYDFSLDIDVTGLRTLVAKAARNKTGKSVDGPINVTFHGKRD